MSALEESRKITPRITNPGEYGGKCPVSGKGGEFSHVSYADVCAAHRRIQANGVHRTPVATSKQINALAGGLQIFFKCENLQKVGAFKFRGASNAILKLAPEERARGVVTHSSGNMAQALALAAQMAGVPANIVMPSNAPQVKKDAVRGYGATITECPPVLAERVSNAQRLIDATGGCFLHPYDHPDIIAGQGTAGLELLQEQPALGMVIAPVGGGGLLSGVAIAAHGWNPGVEVWAAEPAGADDAAQSFAAGKLIPMSWKPATVCDGLLTSLGELTWPIIREHVARVVTVTDAETVAAQRLLFERLKLVVEPSGATGLAAVLKPENLAYLKRKGITSVGIVISGGNLVLDALFKSPPNAKL
jgi:threonine dehydratase